MLTAPFSASATRSQSTLLTIKLSMLRNGAMSAQVGFLLLLALIQSNVCIGYGPSCKLAILL